MTPLKPCGKYFGLRWEQPWLGFRVAPSQWAGNFPQWSNYAVFKNGTVDPRTATYHQIPLEESSVEDLQRLTSGLSDVWYLMSIHFRSRLAVFLTQNLLSER